MSLDELSTSAFSGPRERGPADDRLPPQDVNAERSVLGGMLLSKDAIADCVEQLKGTDFYRPAHELIYDAILDLYGRGEPADAITVADELTKRGDLMRIGGQAYIHELISAVPTAANAGYYAQIVAERAVLRRLVEAGTRIVQLGYGQGGGDVEDIVNAAQAEVYSVADKRGGEDYHVIGDIIEATVDEIEVASGRSGEMTGVPTGFTDLDTLTNGLHPGQMIVVAARPAMGKALALDTPLATPLGWTTMGEVAVGDFVLGADGRPTHVVAATEVMKGRPCYEVEFSDGSVILADEQHQWVVSVDGGEACVSTTGVLADQLGAGRRPAISRTPGAGTALAADEWKIERITPIASVPVRCIEVAAADHLFLAGEAMIPTHNSTLGLDIARSAAIKHKMASVVFSLEMSRTEITMRLLSAEAGIQLQHMRKGTMRDEDWTRLASTMGKVSDAPLFIDDSPNMSLMEIRAKCRRLKQRHNLKLVIIDYLQLMTSGKRVESRQQEVSEFSRALKLLAKELEVPVIAISQLNRGPEQRTDKKPAMSDLRESGCLTAETRVMRADTGAETSLGQLHALGATDVPVWALDEKLRYVTRHLTHVFPTGVKPVFRLTLASGKTLRATANHPFLAYAGWTALGDLRTGDRIAVPRHVPAPEMHVPWEDDAEVVAAAAALVLPDRLFHASKRQIALYLRAVATSRGSLSLAEGSITVALAGPEAVAGLSRLLLRFGISTEQHGGGDAVALRIDDRDSRRRFLGEIGFGSEAPQHAVAELMLGELAAPQQGGLAQAQPMSLRESLAQALSGRTVEQREVLTTVATVLDDADLDLHAVNDVLWDDVVSVEPDGVEEVFDATVLGTHNFIANGIAVHNSIEQDADMVILLHREAAYEKDSPREGEADLIVAKHRNGPTDTIVVAFQGHFSRFTNMATNF